MINGAQIIIINRFNMIMLFSTYPLSAAGRKPNPHVRPNNADSIRILRVIFNIFSHLFLRLMDTQEIIIAFQN